MIQQPSIKHTELMKEFKVIIKAQNIKFDKSLIRPVCMKELSKELKIIADEFCRKQLNNQQV